jgi:hypothetical protein
MKLVKEIFDDFEWIGNDLINPWDLGYGGIEFDIEPDPETLNKLIEMALATNPVNINAWSDNARKDDIENILDYFYETGSSFLVKEGDGMLVYGEKFYSDWEGIKIVKYSHLIGKGLNESDDLDWIRDLTIRFDKNHLPKVGDVLICLPGYNGGPSTEVERYAGAGYREGRIIVVEGVEESHYHDPIIWPDAEKSKKYWDEPMNFFECGIYHHALTYYTGENLNESEEKDDFDWIREIKPQVPVPFNQAKVGKTYRVEPTEVLLDALIACGDDDDDIYNSRKAYVTNIDQGTSYSQVHCGSDNDDYVIALMLRFYDDDNVDIGSFWVTEDMLTLYELDENLNESTDDDFKWIRDVDPNKPIQLNSNTLYYFEPPLREGEIMNLRNRLDRGYGDIKHWLNRVSNNEISYFVTNARNSRVSGWCYITPVEEALELYDHVYVVDGRREFSI